MITRFYCTTQTLIPGIVEICSLGGASAGGDDSFGVSPVTFAPCSGGENYNHNGGGDETFHHFELIVKNVYPIQIHALWLGFFASVVAPFGGFLASAIKRAYGIKDFDSLIPGHGGITDRLDCQFMMALYTWVHYNSFCRLTTISVPKMVYHYNLLSSLEKEQFLEAIVPTNDPELLQRFQEYALSTIR